MTMNKKYNLRKEYAVYDKEDNLLMIGTARECTEYLGLTIDSFYCRVSKLRTGKANGRYKGKVIPM